MNKALANQFGTALTEGGSFPAVCLNTGRYRTIVVLLPGRRRLLGWKGWRLPDTIKMAGDPVTYTYGGMNEALNMALKRTSIMPDQGWERSKLAAPFLDGPQWRIHEPERG
jgi:hypothetical protein